MRKSPPPAGGGLFLPRQGNEAILLVYLLGECRHTFVAFITYTFIIAGK